MQNIRIVEIPSCTVAVSKPGMFGNGNLERFDEWFSGQPRGIWPKDFLYFENGAFRWACIVESGADVPAEFEICRWNTGLYAVATDIDGQTDKEAMDKAVNEFIAKHGLERDASRPEMGNVITPPSAAEILGFCQMDYWYSVKKKA